MRELSFKIIPATSEELETPWNKLPFLRQIPARIEIKDNEGWFLSAGHTQGVLDELHRLGATEV